MKEPTLSEKRKELFEDLLKKYKSIPKINEILFVILNMADEQDREFISRLKDAFWFGTGDYTGDLIHKEIDKLAGSELTHSPQEVGGALSDTSPVNRAKPADIQIPGNCKYCGQPTNLYFKNSKVCDKCKSKLARKAANSKPADTHSPQERGSRKANLCKPADTQTQEQLGKLILSDNDKRNRTSDKKAKDTQTESKEKLNQSKIESMNDEKACANTKLKERGEEYRKEYWKGAES